MERGCRNCMWLYHMVTHNQTAPCSECLDYDKWQTAKSTNADRIRSMTDEELADYLRYYSDSYARYDMDWLDWLKEEAKDGE